MHINIYLYIDVYQLFTYTWIMTEIKLSSNDQKVTVLIYISFYE